MIDSTPTELAKVDEAFIVIDQIKRKRMKMVKEMEKRLDLNENQKIFIGNEYELWRNVKSLTDQVDGTVRAHLGRALPRDHDLEEVVLGAILLHTKDGAEPSAMNRVRMYLLPEHFYDDNHREIYRACMACGNTLDLRTVTYQLRKMGKLEEIGGGYALAELTAKVSSSSNIENHAHILIEMAVKREIIKVGSYIVQNAYEDSRDFVALLEYSRQALLKLTAWLK